MATGIWRGCSRTPEVPPDHAVLLRERRAGAATGLRSGRGHAHRDDGILHRPHRRGGLPRNGRRVPGPRAGVVRRAARGGWVHHGLPRPLSVPPTPTSAGTPGGYGSQPQHCRRRPFLPRLFGSAPGMSVAVPNNRGVDTQADRPPTDHPTSHRPLTHRPPAAHPIATGRSLSLGATLRGPDQAPGARSTTGRRR